MNTIQKFIKADINPDDTISEISFHPNMPLIAVSSWDKTIRFYSIENGLLQKLVVNTDEPLLCLSFDKTGSSLFAGSVNGKVFKYDLNCNKTINLPLHESGVKGIRFYNNLLITGSWDKTIKFHDIQSGSLTNTIDLDNKLYCMDLKSDLLAYAISGNRLCSMNMTNFYKKNHVSRLTWQIRSISCSNDNNSFAIGGIEGRVECINVNASYKNYAFKAHRSGNSAYSVNVVSVHPFKDSLVATGGSDGQICINDKENKIRLYGENVTYPVTAGCFNQNGTYLAYGIGEDWSKGLPETKIPTELRIMDVSSYK